MLVIEMQNKELERNNKRQKEIESYLRNEEKVFELEKRSELQHITSLKKKKQKKKLEQDALDTKKLNDEKKKRPIKNHNN